MSICNLTLLKHDIKDFIGRFYYRFMFKKKNNIFSVDELFEKIEGMGIQKGDSLIVFSSMENLVGGSFGFSSYKYANDIVDRLMKLVGDDGEILMPTYPNVGSLYLYALRKKIFYKNKTPSGLGLLTEVFRKKKNVYRSGNPVRPVSVFSKDWEWYIKDHLTSPVIDDTNSPYYKFYKHRKGKILLLGTYRNSLLHLPDLLAKKNINYELYFKKFFTFLYDENGEIKKYDAQLHLNGIYGNTKKYSEYIYDKCDIKTRKMGNVDIKVIDAKTCVDVAVNEIIKNNLSMYSPEFF